MEESQRREAAEDFSAREDTASVSGERVDVPDIGELRARIEAKDGHTGELYDEISRVRLVADEARAAREAGERRIGDLESERDRLRERLGSLEREGRWRRLRRERNDRQARRLEREIEHLRGEVAERDRLIREKDVKLNSLTSEAADRIFRKEEALDHALRRIEGLQQDLEERETDLSELQTTVGDLRAELEEEREARRRLAEPENRLRAGISLFNSSQKLRVVGSISKSLGNPEVRAVLGAGDQPPVEITFVWRDITWQTYSANPGPDVEEPRVYMKNSGDDFSWIEREPPNARIGPDGRVLLGL